MSTNIRKNKPTSTPAHVEEDSSEENGFLLEPSKIEVGAGYTLRVGYDHQDNQIVNVKTYGKVDIAKIRNEIQKAFPEAQIRQESRTITVAKKHTKKQRR